ncbi:MAG: cyclodeaminase/cyclohydrolase family protein [Clostridiales bacterium]|nr:cyclodeaminase/cyclohydrolase family protein [Clostridiales bacterium]
MELSDKTLESYLEILASDAPAPGGGSASAFCGAQGAALVEMVARLTLGRAKYAEYAELCESVITKAAELNKALIIQVDADADAYEAVRRAVRLSKSLPQAEQDVDLIAAAVEFATETPYKTMELCLEALNLAKSLLNKSNKNAASDLGVAALNLVTGVYGAYLNVKINIFGREDERAELYRTGCDKIIAEAKTIAKEIFNAVDSAL